MERTQDSGLGSLAVIERKGEMAIAAAAANAKALVEARFVIAYNRPRKLMEARSAILDACKRERFAEAARYKKPVGKKQVNGVWTQQFIEGFSIRFAEVAIQAMKNITVETSIMYEDDSQRTVHVSVTDLESNLCYGEDITISKTVERRNLKEGQEKVGERLNSYGDKVFIVAATDDEVANKVAAQRSKVIRNSGLRLIPQDFLEEASDVIQSTLEKGGSDPKAEMKKIVDAFNAIGVGASELEKYLAHSLDTISKKELIDLRAVYSAVKDGEASWADYVSGEQNVPRAEATPGPAPAKAPFRRSATTDHSKTKGEIDAETELAVAGLAPVQKTPDTVIDINSKEAFYDRHQVTPEKIQEMVAVDAKAKGVTPDPQKAAVDWNAPSAASGSREQNTESLQSEAISTTSESASPVSSKGAAKPAPALPPSKMPEGWHPNPEDISKSFFEWCSGEEIAPEEIIKWCMSGGRGYAKAGQKVSDLSTSKLSGILKIREQVRKDILEACQ